MFENTNQTPPKLVNNITNWVVDIGATRHICLSKELFLNYEEVIDEENVYLGDSGTARVAGKGKVLLKFTSGKSLALHSIVHVPNMCRNLECVWIEIIHSCVFNFTRFPFFSFQPQLLTRSSVNSVLVHCSRVSQIPLFINFFIKNESHSTIHTLKNYFATVF